MNNNLTKRFKCCKYSFVLCCLLVFIFSFLQTVWLMTNTGAFTPTDIQTVYKNDYINFEYYYMAADTKLSHYMYDMNETNVKKSGLNATWISSLGMLVRCNKSFGIANTVVETEKRNIVSRIDMYNHNKDTKKSQTFLSQLLNGSNIKNGDIIFLSDAYLLAFIDYILPSINKYFSIVFYGTDNTFPSLQSYKHGDVKIFALLENKYLLSIFSKNGHNCVYKYQHMSRFFKYNIKTIDASKLLNITDQEIRNFKNNILKEKLDYVPLGIQYFAQLNYPIGTFVTRARFGKPVSLKNKEIKELIHQLKLKYNQREMKIYVDWVLTQFKKYDIGKLFDTKRDLTLENVSQMYSIGGNYFWIKRDKYAIRSLMRSDAYYSLLNLTKTDSKMNDLIVFGDSYLNQYDLFNQRSKYSFLFSVGGHGMDTYRMWEGLICGSVIISKKTPFLNGLVEKHGKDTFPIILVDSYYDINSTMIEYYYKKYQNMTSLTNKKVRYMLTNDYWINYVKNQTNRRLDLVASR